MNKRDGPFMKLWRGGTHCPGASKKWKDQVDRSAQKENSMPRENGFENKRVVIIGGSSGIGLAVAKEAASQGTNVVIVSSNAERVEEAVKSIGGKARGEADGGSVGKRLTSYCPVIVGPSSDEFA